MKQSIGVGTLSAVNGIAGAHSEYVPVILISGYLPLRAIQRRARCTFALVYECKLQNNLVPSEFVTSLIYLWSDATDICDTKACPVS